MKKLTAHTEQQNVCELIIIGGGAAGLYAGAASLAAKNSKDSGSALLIIERSREPGKKLLITGSGQCNLTHSGPIKDFLPHYHEAGKKSGLFSMLIPTKR